LLIKILKELSNIVDQIVQIICIIILAGMLITVSAGVFFRYFLKNPLVWSEELSRFLMVWLVFLGASLVIKRWDNIRVTLFLEKLPEKISSVIDFIIKIFVYILLVIVLITSLSVIPTVGMQEIAPALGIKMIIPELGLVLGILLMLFQLTVIIIEDMLKFHANKGKGSE